MSTEAQVAMLMLRLLVDRPRELSKVIDYLQKQVLRRKAELEAGISRAATREEIMNEFIEKYGLTVDITDDDVPERVHKELLSDELSRRMHGLPAGGRFKLG